MSQKLELSGVEDRNFWLIAGTLAAVGFAFQLLVSWQLFERNVFYYHNNVFDGDPDVYLRYILGFAQMARRHPLMMVFVFPLGLCATIAQSLLHWPFRIWSVIVYGPLLGAAKSILLMVAMRRISMPLWWAALITLADALSLARLTVGSMPESFGFTSTVFALLFLLCASAITGKGIRAGMWVVCGVLLCGITITNTIPWALALGCVLLQTEVPLRPTILRAVRIFAAAMLAVGVIYAGIALTVKPPSTWAAYIKLWEEREPGVAAPQDTQVDTVRYIRFNPRLLPLIAPLADTYAFTGPPPEVAAGSSDAGYFPGHPVPRARLILPSQWAAQWLLPLALVHGLLILGLLGWFRGTNWRRQLVLPALLIIGFQLSLHCFWGGNELYLYVLHWQTALLMLMAGAWYCNGLIRRAATGGLLALIVCEIVMNSRDIAFALQALDAQFVPR